MNTILRTILAIILGLITGSLVNMGIIMISGSVIPPPAGVDTTTMEGLKEALPFFKPKHFLMPFLAHAIGTLVGAFVAAYIVKKHKIKVGLSIGLLFLIGGIVNVLILPSPLWFSIADILLAYIPLAYLGARLAEGLER